MFGNWKAPHQAHSVLLLTGTPIHLQMAQQCEALVHVQDRKVTIDSSRSGAERFQVKQSQLKEKSNTKKVVYPRQ